VSVDGLAVFTEAGDGDLRADPDARRRLSSRLGIKEHWAVVDQVHGSAVLDVDEPGTHGQADGLFTEIADLPLAVFTADCVGVVLMADDAIGVAHAGWRGAAAGVVTALRARFESSGREVRRAVIGPHIRSCCFEVGPEVAERFPEHVAETSWGTTSVDLAGVIRSQLDGVDVEDFSACTYHEEPWFSHRRDSNPRRLAALAVRRSRV
jgi:YfiH family protein